MQFASRLLYSSSLLRQEQDLYVQHGRQHLSPTKGSLSYCNLDFVFYINPPCVYTSGELILSFIS